MCLKKFLVLDMCHKLETKKIKETGETETVDLISDSILKGNSGVKMNLFWLIVLFPVFAILMIFCSESLLQLRYLT